MDWRKIEQALIEVAKSYNHDVEQETKSGDTYIYVTENQINATELAKQLAEKLS